MCIGVSCMYVCTMYVQCLQWTERALNPLELELLSAATWGLGTEPGSSGRAASGLSHPATPNPLVITFTLDFLRHSLIVQPWLTLNL